MMINSPDSDLADLLKTCPADRLCELWVQACTHGDDVAMMRTIHDEQQRRFREVMTGLGATPEQIAELDAAAETIAAEIRRSILAARSVDEV
jgi:hypothetical protein